MNSKREELKRQREVLLAELPRLGEFRRGSINVFYRRCGKPRCVCTRPGHPGHGPVTTLTFKAQGLSQARMLTTPAAVALTRTQLERHDQFQAWCRRFVAVNEALSDQRLAAVRAGEVGEEATPEKKLRRRSRRR